MFLKLTPEYPVNLNVFKASHKQTNRQTDKHTNRQTDKQTNRQTDAIKFYGLHTVVGRIRIPTA